ncbi:MAG: ATP-binding cassette domain-containing protein [Deltaproteobacteria bacterium]|nr:ATP-binding cassette domain-containing protein [Deltaproteobacteria bacterium]
MSLFRLRGLRRVYGDRTVLDIPELDFREGAICALLGPNGSGKTTLIEILALLRSPTEGILRYRDKLVDFSSGDLHALRREIVMVGQNPVLFSTTVQKNLDFGLKVRKVPKRQRAVRIDEALDLVGMRDFAQADATALSGGETQRVAIARALVCSPRVMLLDEPTSNVDAENQAVIERILGEINRVKGIFVLFATHDLDQAARLSLEVVSPLSEHPAGEDRGTGEGPEILHPG